MCERERERESTRDVERRKVGVICKGGHGYSNGPMCNHRKALLCITLGLYLPVQSYTDQSSLIHCCGSKVA